MSKPITKYGCWVLLMLATLGLHAQLVTNNGAMVHTHAGCEVYVLGDGVANNSGTMENAGYWYIDGDMENGGLLTGFGESTGVYEVKQNWINNGTFQSDQSEVILSGDDQLIGGSSVSSFHDLSLLGTGIKSQSVDAEVKNQLDLSSIELDTDEYEMHLASTDPLAIARSTGFVSSQGSGRLSWNLAAGSTYFYPVGFHLSNSNLRPVELIANNAGTYKVRLAEGEATNEGFPFSQFNAPGICKVNRNYFHYIDAQPGGNTDISIFSHATNDPFWDSMVQWNGWEWNDTEVPTLSSEDIYNVTTIDNWNDFTDPVFDLASSSVPTLDFVQDDMLVDLGATIELEAVYSEDESEIAGIEWFSVDELSNPDALITEVTPAGSTVYGLEVSNELGCIAYDEIQIRTRNRGLVIPTAFSPNGDGVHDVIEPLSPYLNMLDFSIYNRWGEQVFEGTLDSPAWDGTYNSVEQPVGVYTFVAKYKLGVSNKVFLESGNITLVR